MADVQYIGIIGNILQQEFMSGIDALCNDGIVMPKYYIGIKYGHPVRITNHSFDNVLREKTVVWRDNAISNANHKLCMTSFRFKAGSINPLMLSTTGSSPLCPPASGVFAVN